VVFEFWLVQDFKKVNLLLDLISLVDTAWGDVVQVLEPLEVGAGDTTSIDKHVWSANDALGFKDLISLVGGWAVSSLEDSAHLDLVSVASVQRLLDGSWDHAVSLLEEEGVGVLGSVLSGFWISCEGSVLGQVVLHVVNLEAVWVVDSRVVFDDGSDLSTVSLNELGGPVADGTESLHNEGLVLDALGQSAFIDKALKSKKFTHSVIDTKTSGLGSAGDSSLVDELTSAAALSVDILLTLDIGVGVLDPGHNLLVSSHVWTKAIH